MPLLDRFLKRHRDIERSLESFEVAFPAGPTRLRQIELAGPATQLFNRAMGVTDGNFSSWMPGLPLPALLAGRRRLTVDLSPVFLRNARRNYGISEEALISLGERRILLFNIREFDPTDTAEEMSKAAKSYEPWAPFLERLLDRAPHSTYFLAALRHPLFDAVPRLSARKDSLRTFYNESAKLQRIADAAAALSDTDPAVLGILFRGERTTFKATRWHWAYVNSVASFIPADALASVRLSFERLASAAPNYVTATLFLQLQNRLRYMHLAFSAPLSASFGGPYGMSLRDDYTFMQGVRHAEDKLFLYDFMPDRLLDLVQDLQLGRIRPEFRRMLKHDRHWELLRQFASESVHRNEPVTYFEHFDQKSNLGELIAYFEDNAHTLETYRTLEIEMEALLDDTNRIRPDALLDIAARTVEARYVRNGAIMKHNEGFMTVRGPDAESTGPGARPVPALTIRAANLVWHMLAKIGDWATDLQPSVSGAGDIARIGYDAPFGFRSNPT